MAIKDSLSAARALSAESGGRAAAEPVQYAGRGKRYFADRSRAFGAVMAKYAADFVLAKVQGLDPASPTAWVETRIRAAELIRPTASLTRDFDDYKQIYFADERITYLQPGTKLQFLGSTWLATNPSNLSNGMSAGVVQRCNAVWCYYDAYGNVQEEPLCVENRRADSNAPDVQTVAELSRGYFNVVCQYNAVTASIRNNTRMILGSGAYRVTGLTDFLQEFTSDRSSVRLLRFTARFEEPNDALDNMADRVAGGKAQGFDLRIDGADTVAAGKQLLLIPHFTRDGQEVSASYQWESDNPGVASVSRFGLVTGVSVGECHVTAVMQQNPEFTATVPIQVTQSQGDRVWFVSSFPFSVRPFRTFTVVAGCAEADGSPGEGFVEYTFSGADASSYKAEVDGNTAVIEVYGGSEEPLVISASYGGQTVEEPVILESL